MTKKVNLSGEDATELFYGNPIPFSEPRIEEIPSCLARLTSKIAKICGAYPGVPSSGALFFCEGVANKKTHFKSHVLASPVQLITTAMA